MYVFVCLVDMSMDGLCVMVNMPSEYVRSFVFGVWKINRKVNRIKKGGDKMVPRETLSEC